MSEIKVNSIKGVGASAAAITVNNTDGTCTANLSNRQNRNLIINGAMQVAQRGTSSTSTGVVAVDRFRTYHVSTDEAPTYSQVDVASGTTPYSLGFRKAYRVTNGNQTSGVAATNQIQIDYLVEAQDLANSGWDYTSSSSFITLSYWAKSSVAQEFKAQWRSPDGAAQNYPYSLGSLAANTWTKITKTIPGNSNLQIDNDNGTGLEIGLFSQWGTNLTGSVSENAWSAYSGSVRTPDQTLTWYTTNDATFEITGVQLEVGSVATDFEHRSYQDEFLRCCRYFYFTNAQHFSVGRGNNSDGFVGWIELQVPLRNTPAVTLTGGLRQYGIDSYSDSTTAPTIPSFRANQKGIRINQTGHSGVNDDCVLTVQTNGSDGQGLAFDAEL